MFKYFGKNVPTMSYEALGVPIISTMITEHQIPSSGFIEIGEHLILKSILSIEKYCKYFST